MTARSHFVRDKFRRDPVRRFYLYVEGERTEVDYFDALQRLIGWKDVRLEIKWARGPKNIAVAAIAKLQQLKRSKNAFEKDDQVWAVFDRDNHAHYFHAIALCERNQIGVARSVPCFEVWLILHDEEFQSLDDTASVCAHLKTLHPEYDPGRNKSCDCTDMVQRVHIDEHRARTQLARRVEEGDAHGRPSTTVGLLTAAIRAAAEEAASRDRQER